ncbi:hypothetical protein [Cnuella takakiae]|nr:hypothetical protein [Cnuella takakiae]
MMSGLETKRAISVWLTVAITAASGKPVTKMGLQIYSVAKKSVLAPTIL